MKKADHLENPMDALVHYENKKLFALKGLIACFIAWQLGQMMLNNFAEQLHSYVTMTFQIFSFLGALGWAGLIFYLISISRFLKKDANLNNQVNDERTSLLRLQAMSYGFMITLGVTSLFFGVSTLLDAFPQSFELSGSFVSQSIILVSISATWISYLILDRDE